MRLLFKDQAAAPEDPLPEYDSPPVIETSVGIQFDGLDQYTSLAAADFRKEIVATYPIVEEWPPLDPGFETFGASDSRIINPQLTLITEAIRPRFFFVTRDGSELLQLQRDRLFFNWRRTEKGEAYPRYTHVRAQL